MIFSKFGKKFTRSSGITQLMQDLGKANNSNDPDIVMLGGGNPALIPEVSSVFSKELQLLIEDDKIDNLFGLYDGPQGNDSFRAELSNMLNEHYDWELSVNNISLSNGSQANFFSLFNLLAGEMPDGSKRKIIFPLAPEYVGYADQGLSEDMFVSVKPKICILDNTNLEYSKQFKYEIDFNALKNVLKSDTKIGALCVSRPTNPTGNVITDCELQTLDELAKQYNIPLIIDNAYGHPFPGTIYSDVKLTWNSNIILCMSLSKLGLPGLRTGIVVANEEIITAMSRINGNMILAPNSVGPKLMTRLLKDKELLSLCTNTIKPFYAEKAATAIALFNEIFANKPVYLHKIEGAFFMWLWFKELSITSDELYQSLKEDKIFVIPGHNFFIGIEDSWEHKHQCIRLNYAKDEAILRKGLEAIRKIISE